MNKSLLLLLILISINCFPKSSKTVFLGINYNIEKANFYVSKNDYSRAIKYYEKAIKCCSTNQKETITDIYLKIAGCYDAEGNSTKTFQLNNEILRMYNASTKSDTLRFKTLNHFSIFFQEKTFQISKADSCFKCEFELLSSRPNLFHLISGYVQNFWLNWSHNHYLKGDYKATEMYIKAGIDVAKKSNLENEITGSLWNELGLYYQVLDKNEEASLAYLKSITIFKKMGYINYLNRVYINLAKNYQEENKLVESGKLLEKVLNDKYYHKDYVLIKKLLFASGNLQFEQEEYSKALMYFNKLEQNLNDRHELKGEWRSKCLLGKAKVYFKLGQLNKSMAFCQKAIIANTLNFEEKKFTRNPFTNQVLNIAIHVEILRFKSLLLEEKYKLTNQLYYLDNSLSSLLTSIDILKQSKNSFVNGESNLILSAQSFPILDHSIQLSFKLLNLTKQEKYEGICFSLLNDTRGNTLKERSNLFLKSIPKNNQSKVFDMILDLEQVNSKLKGGYSNGDKTTTKTIIDNDLKIFELKKQIFKSEEVFSLASFQNALKKKVFIGYHISEQGLYSYTSDNKNSAINFIPIEKKELLIRLNDYKKEISRMIGKIGSYNHRYSFECYKYLIKPIERNWKKDGMNIIISQDSRMNIPFESLEWIKDDFLILHHTFSYIPNLSCLLFLNRTSKPKKLYTLGLAPFANQGLVSEKAQISWDRIPHSEKEVKSVSDVFLIDKQASKTTFLKRANQYNNLLISTHGFSGDAIGIEEPFLAFNGDANNSKLYYSEIASLDLSSVKCCTLSACDSDEAIQHEGEGNLSLGKAFLMAGVPNVVCSIFKMNDEASEQLVKDFQQNMQAGKSSSEALRQAKLDFIKSKYYKENDSPFYWAGLILYGSQTEFPLIDKQSLYSSFTYSLLLMVLIGLSVWILRKYRKPSNFHA